MPVVFDTDGDSQGGSYCYNDVARCPLFQAVEQENTPNSFLSVEIATIIISGMLTRSELSKSSLAGDYGVYDAIENHRCYGSRGREESQCAR